MSAGVLALVVPLLLLAATTLLERGAPPRRRPARVGRVGRVGRLDRGAKERVLVVTGSYGAGHDAAAREISLRLRAAGVDTATVDVVDMFPAGLGAAFRRLYFAQLDVAPGSWAWVLGLLGCRGGAGGVLAAQVRRGIGRLAARRLLDCVDDRTVAVISTHPFASQALGTLRATSRLHIPVTTYLTDASVHALWVHPGVDQHLAIHQQAAAQARALGAANTVLIEPMTPSVHVYDDPATIRRRLGIPVDRPIALVVGGSEGVGDLARTAYEVRDAGLAVPVVVCARNASLRTALEAESDMVVLGWLDGLTDVIAASDCVVQNSGGFTSLETLALGVPLISYRCLPGHGEENARALQSEGVAPWPQTPSALATAIADALDRPTETAADGWSTRARLLDVLPVARGRVSS